MQTIPTPLIEKALALTWKTLEDIQEYDKHWHNWLSFEKFCYYLLSPGFINKYYESQRPWHTPDQATLDLMSWEFGYAIYTYQSGDSSKIINLLSKKF